MHNKGRKINRDICDYKYLKPEFFADDSNRPFLVFGAMCLALLASVFAIEVSVIAILFATLAILSLAVAVYDYWKDLQEFNLQLGPPKSTSIATCLSPDLLERFSVSSKKLPAGFDSDKFFMPAILEGESPVPK